MLSYVTEILAYLPFNHLGDVLFILHSISETIALEGNETLRNLATFLRSSGLTDADPDPTVVDEAEKAASKKNPSRSKSLSVLQNNEGFDLYKFSELCSKACSLSLLVKLYFYLRDAYKGVTEKRLVEYNPGEKERINDRGMVKAANLLSFDSHMPNTFTSCGIIDKDNLIRQYAIFRSAMRKYDSSFMVQNEDSKNNSSEDDTDDKVHKKRKISVLETISDQQ